MAIICGNRSASHCMGSHPSVAAVKACYRGQMVQGSLDMDPPVLAALPEMKEGMWKIGERVFKVQIAHHGSGRLYCKELLVEEDVPGGEQYSHYWEMRSGFMPTLRREGAQMTLEEAKKFGALYGFCCNCGKILTNEKSIELGIGPVCRGRFS